MDVWRFRDTVAYREVIAVALAEADVELAQAAASPDLSSSDSGVLYHATSRLKHAQSDVDALTTLIAQLGYENPIEPTPIRKIAGGED